MSKIITQDDFLKRYHYDPIRDRLGTGGFGSVYKAHDTTLHRNVAIKIAEVRKSETGKKIFSLRDEVLAVSKLPAHPNVAHYEKDELYTFTLSNGVFDYAVMQYYPDGNLSESMKKGLTTGQKEDIARQLLEGIAFLHEHKVVHRDLKPANILIVKQNGKVTPVITDFGLSKSVDETLFSNSFTGGTRRYSAPEQLQSGQPLKFNVDLWSYGVIVYELFTGKPLFSADSGASDSEQAEKEIFDKITKGNVGSLHKMSEKWRKVAERCLIVDSKDRVQNADELFKILDSYDGDRENGQGDQKGGVGFERLKKYVKIVLASVILIIGFVGWRFYEIRMKTFAQQEFEEGSAYYEDKQYTDALDWFLKSAKHGNDEAQRKLGIMYLNGYGVDADTLEAVKWYRKSANQGNTRAQYNMGTRYYYGEGVLKDEKKALKWYKKAAKKGDDDAQLKLAIMYHSGEGVNQDYNVAAEWCLKSAEQGNDGAQWRMGYMYYYGEGVEQDYAKAIEWYRKSAEQGNDIAQRRLGDMYHEGEVVTQDYATAMEWYRKSAEQGNDVAQRCLGIIYYYGQGVTQDYAEAFEWYKKSAEQGNVKAQTIIGYMYYFGQGVTQDYAEAFEWYRKSAEQGNDEAQWRLGSMYYDGEGMSQDYAKAMEWYRKSAEQGNEVAQMMIGNLYYDGKGVPQDYAKAMEWYMKSAEQGNMVSQRWLGDMYRDGKGTSQDYVKAMEWYRKSAEQGNEVAQVNIGIMYHDGVGVNQNYSLAMEWYQKSAVQGNAIAQRRLGSMYFYGEGVPRDNAKAMEWLKKSADQGDDDAQNIIGVIYAENKDYTEALKWWKMSADNGNEVAELNLGEIYYRGDGVKKNYSEAIAWYRRSADRGNAEAQLSLGNMYYYGKGVSQDYSEAMSWYRKSAEQGNELAQFNIGVMFEYGDGVVKDLEEAKKWYQKAADQGYQEAIDHLKELGENKDGINSDSGSLRNNQQSAMSGVFSITSTKKVFFSKGNLQYQASTNTWRFAENQWDYIGEANMNVSPTYAGWVDLFGWGTSGYNHGAKFYQPWSTSKKDSDYYVYGSKKCNLYDENGTADWGKNAILNGSENRVWYTLTEDEWKYLVNERKTNSNIRFVKAVVNGVKGLILLPDDWDASVYKLRNPNPTSHNISFSNNVISASQWKNIFETKGAVFLPAAGSRSGNTIDKVGIVGNYWLASIYPPNGSFAYCVFFCDWNCDSALSNRSLGCSVRLVTSFY